LPLTEASFRAANGRTYRTRIGDIYEALDGPDSEVLDRVLADRSISHEAVADTLTKAGYSISTNAVRHYRAKVLGWA
jgi:hypothetical protein